MCKEFSKIFKIKKDISNKLNSDGCFRRKFKKLRRTIVERKQEKGKEFYCIFNDCNKVFPNYTRWMLHYKMHVSQAAFSLLFSIFFN